MFLELSRSLLGRWGVIILDFYLGNQIIINLIIVAYGIYVIIIRYKRKKHPKE